MITFFAADADGFNVMVVDHPRTNILCIIQSHLLLRTRARGIFVFTCLVVANIIVTSSFFRLTIVLALPHISIPTGLGRCVTGSHTSFVTKAAIFVQESDSVYGVLRNNILPRKEMVGPQRRRSPRLCGLHAGGAATTTTNSCTDENAPKLPMIKKRSSRSDKVDDAHIDASFPEETTIKSKKKRTRSTPNSSIPIEIVNDDNDLQGIEIQNSKKSKTTTLPRTLEDTIRRTNPNVKYVLGIDEAGRGPLAGPVVVGGIRMISSTCSNVTSATTNSTSHIVEGVTDSKKITLEPQRELLYTQLIDSLSKHSTVDGTNPDDAPMIMGAIAVIDAVTIDEINILQATLLGMRSVALVLMGHTIQYPIISIDQMNESVVPMNGCYVIVINSSITKQETIKGNDDGACSDADSGCDSSFHALIDGNRLPTDMPCPADAIVKGDSREYCIAAASILAKVTRDRIMHQYHDIYPAYNLSQHKGYPTAAHINAIRTHGPTPIHRLTFAPLKPKVVKVKKLK